MNDLRKRKGRRMIGIRVEWQAIREQHFNCTVDVCKMDSLLKEQRHRTLNQQQSKL